MNKRYERHSNDIYAENLPIIFHYDCAVRKNFDYIHWHENIEILFFDEGEGEILIDEHIFTASAGDIVIVNSEELHSTRTLAKHALYYCLIIDKEFCKNLGFFIDEQHICNVIKDKEIFEKIHKIKDELANKREFYVPAITSTVIEILTELYRKYQFTKSKYTKNKNIEMVKSGISYIKKHFDKQPSVDNIANHVGYSKYYFCRCFKEITGYTVNSYINSVKIEHAKEMLLNRKISISEVSEACGFSDISYFTKIFKKYAGVLPSKVKAEKQGE